MIKIEKYDAQRASLSMLTCMSVTQNKRRLYIESPSLFPTLPNQPRSLS